MKVSYLIIVSILFFAIDMSGQTPVSHPDVDWEIYDKFSDEFNSNSIDQDKWDNDVNDWGTWSWEPANAYTSDSTLTLRMIQDQHFRGDKEYYFTSGINRSRDKMIYGYFETKILASPKGQGTCPAFWMYSKGEPNPTEEGGVKYCEIDAVEIFQKPYDEQRLEMNLHTRILEDGQLVWKRPGQGDPELTANTWEAPWDPRDEYHTYATWNRPDSIFWYVDGIQRGAKKNYYWHKPMYVTVSMGLRTPYEIYINGVRTVVEYPESDPEPGFPTEMQCDFVRVYKTPAQMYADKEIYYDQSFSVGQDLMFRVYYFAGNEEEVTEEGWDGMTCFLNEMDADGNVVNETKIVNSTVIGKEAGEVRFTFDLDEYLPSDKLPEGNFYALKPIFRTSMNQGQEVTLKEEFYPVTLISTSSVNDPGILENVEVRSDLTNIDILINDLEGEAKVKIFDMSGRILYNQKHFNNHVSINSSLIGSGVFVVKVEINEKSRVAKIVLSDY